MNSDRIVIRRTESGMGYYTVEADGRMCTYLCWSEMLEQVIALTHPDVKGPRYHWRTTEEEIAEEDRRRVAVAKVNTPDEKLPTLQPLDKSCRMYSCDVCHTISESPLNACGRVDCEQIPF